MNYNEKLAQLKNLQAAGASREDLKVHAQELAVLKKQQNKLRKNRSGNNPHTKKEYKAVRYVNGKIADESLPPLRGEAAKIQHNPSSASLAAIHSADTERDWNADQLESEHVHKVYDAIADHFSSSRHSAWPSVERFVQELPPGSLVADVGCGNGKYMNLNSHIFSIGCDRSAKLLLAANLRHLATDNLECAQIENRTETGQDQRGTENSECSKNRTPLELFTSDVLQLPLRSGASDAVLCVAVLHHLSTEKRRLKVRHSFSVTVA
jgi:2-polyprenyl-3-methyl-5-hydroxy-6-metoxy-1,4-benzoquinol methylase